MITKPFAFHTPSADAMETIRQLRRQFTATATLIETVCPHSRERSTAITQLETAATWAIKAAVANDLASEAQTEP